MTLTVFVYSYITLTDSSLLPPIALIFIYLGVLIFSSKKIKKDKSFNITVEKFFKVRMYLTVMLYIISLMSFIYNSSKISIGLLEFLLYPVFIFSPIIFLFFIINKYKPAKYYFFYSTNLIESVIDKNTQLIRIILAVELGCVICLTILKLIK